jgi:GDP-L-fucose synthase
MYWKNKMNKESKIYVSGHTGMVGSSIIRRLKILGYNNIITKTSEELDLRNQICVARFFEKEKPEYVFLAAAKVGGIGENIAHPASMLYDNLAIQNNVLHYSYKSGVKKLVFLGSSCIYPRLCPQPMKEEYLLTGPLEPTNEGYA